MKSKLIMIGMMSENNQFSEHAKNHRKSNILVGMIFFVVLALLSFVSATDYGTNCTDISLTGDSAHRADITFVGHGYADNATEMARFWQDAIDVINFTFSRAPYSNYSTMFNFRIVNQSANLSCVGVSCSSTAARNLANANCPVNDKIYILVGDAGYGGFGGGQVAMGGTQTIYKGYIFSHEIGGHSFGELMDEYNTTSSGGLYYSGANCATAAQADYTGNSSIPCTKWNTIPGTGCYPACSYYNLFRSTWMSVMRSTGSNDFNRVSIIQINKMVDKWSNMTIDYNPKTNYEINASQSAYFNVTKVNESDNSTVYWFINDSEITESRGNSSLDYVFNNAGNYTIKAFVQLYEINQSYEWNVSVNGTNQAPNITSYLPLSESVSVDENSSLAFNITAEDPENATLAYSWKLDNVQQSTNQNWTYSPDYSSAGNHNVTIFISDGSLTASQYWNVTVNNVNSAPVLDTIVDQSVNENQQLSFNITATDAEGDTITYSANSTLTVNKINNTLATVTWTPSYNDAGIHYFNLTASDGSAADSKIVKVTVNNVNRAPVLDSISDKTIVVNNELRFNITATDEDSDSLTYASNNTELTVTKINNTLAEVVWTPHSAGINYIKFNVTDGTAVDEKTAKINVTTPVTAEVSCMNCTDCSSKMNNNTILRLSQDVVYNDTCIIINSDDVTFDCQGHSIYINATASSKHAVQLSGARVNVTVKNCNINGTGYTGGRGINVVTSGRELVLENLNITNMNFSGMYLNGVSNSKIRNNIISRPVYYSGTNYGIYMLGTSNNTVFENNSISGYTNGFYSTSGNVKLINLTGNDFLNNGSSSIDIYITSPQNFTLWGNNIYGKGITATNTENSSFCVDGIGNYFNSLSGLNTTSQTVVNGSCGTLKSAWPFPSVSNFNGLTTNFSLTDSAIADLVLENSYGKIVWLNTLNVDHADLSSNVNISYNFTEVNIANLPQLNSSANITLYNLSWSNAKAMIDRGSGWEECPATICTKLNYTSGNLTFNVTYMAKFAAAETPLPNNQPTLNAIADQSINESTELRFNVTGTDPDLIYGDNLTYSANSTLTVTKINNTLATVTWTPSYSDAGIYYFKLKVNDSAGLEDTKDVKVTVNDVCATNWTFDYTAWDSCGTNDNQSRIKYYYDSNSCGYENPFSNTTESQTCNYCSYNPVNTSWTGWQNQGSCLANDSQVQNRSKTEYDANYGSCYAITGLASDLWNSGNNKTYWDSQSVFCDYCTPSLTNTSWSSWTNLTCSGDQMNQSRSKTQYDSNSCGEIANSTIYEYQLIGPSLTNTSWSDWTNLTCLTNDKMNQSRSRIQYDSFSCAANLTLTEYRATETCNYANDAPVLDAIADQSVNENQQLSFNITATDAEGDTITYSANSTLTVNKINNTLATVTWTPSYNDAGIHYFNLTASDGSAADSKIVKVTVNNVNRAPVLDSISGIIVYEGENVTISPTASDPDLDSMTFSYSDWMNSNSKQAGYNDQGNHTVNVTVSDGTLTDSRIVNVNVLNSYEFRTAIADRNSKSRLDGSVLLNGVTKSVSSTASSIFDYVHSDSEYIVQYSSSGYQTDNYPIYLDNRLAGCSQGSDCSLAGTYNSDCKWNPAYSDWTCQVSNSGWAYPAFFNYNPSQNAIKRIDYII